MIAKKSPLTKSEDDKELLDWMNKNLKYEGSQRKYLFTPEEVVQKGKGHCWETTELERRELHYLGYDCKTIMLITHNLSTTHTALVYVKDNKFYWFEWAWDKHRGIHGPFDNKRTAFNYIIDLFVKQYGVHIYCFYGFMNIKKEDKPEEYFKRAEQCTEIKINKTNESDKIRLVTILDSGIIKDYRSKVSKYTPYMNNPTEEKIKETIKKYTEDKNKFYYIVIENKEVVGLFAYRIEKEVLHIDHISVSKEKQGTGLAQKLMKFCETEAKKNNINTLELIVHKDNERGIKFYTKLNYVLTKTNKHVLTYQKVLDKHFSLEDW